MKRPSLLLLFFILVWNISFGQSAIPTYSEEEKNIHNLIKVFVFSYPLKERENSLLIDITSRSVAVALERAGFKTAVRSVSQMKEIIGRYDFQRILPLLMKHAERIGSDFIALISYTEMGDRVNFKLDFFMIKNMSLIASVENQARLNLDFDNSIENAMFEIVKESEKYFEEVVMLNAEKENLKEKRAATSKETEEKGTVRESAGNGDNTSRGIKRLEVGVVTGKKRLFGGGLSIGGGPVLPIEKLIDYTDVLFYPSLRIFFSYKVGSSRGDFGLRTGTWFGTITGSVATDTILVIPVLFSLNYILISENGSGFSIFFESGGDTILLLKDTSVDYINFRPGFEGGFGYSFPVSKDIALSFKVAVSITLEAGAPLVGMVSAIFLDFSKLRV